MYYLPETRVLCKTSYVTKTNYFPHHLLSYMHDEVLFNVQKDQEVPLSRCTKKAISVILGSM